MATLTDSIKPTSRYLPKKPRAPPGHLHKGHMKIAASASIPSKYQTIVISNEERKGFNSGTKRFSNMKFTEGPGPANHGIIRPLSQINVSHSKKGLGGFVSKVKRFPESWSEEYNVGPGQYDPNAQSSHDFNRAKCTSNFHKPIAVISDDSKKYQTPAPNQYTLSSGVTGRYTRENHVAASAAFSSKTRRDFLSDISQKTAPAPGTYRFADFWSDDGHTRGAQAPFKSTTQRNMLANKSIVENPGPGTYNPYDKFAACENRKTLPRKHYLCISAPAIPMPPEPDAPGPGQYDLVNYSDAEKQFATSSMFLSTTNRWIPRKDYTAPGPGTYNPNRSGKLSFLYNADKKWI